MKIIQNYKLWLIVSVTFLLMFVAVCIFSAKNFYELDAYRAEKSENINRKAIITRLTKELLINKFSILRSNYIVPFA